MSKKYLSILFPILSISAFLLSACGASISNAATQTQAVAGIFTAAAQTIEANSASFSATPQPSETPSPTFTTSPTVTETVPPTPIPPTSPVQNYCDNSLFISDVTIPDNTVLAPGQAFEKTWAIQNTGTCTWSESYSISFVNGDLMNGTTRTINQSVPAQHQANITIKLNAPNTPGAYTGFWRMTNSKGATFGKIVSVVIKVALGGTNTVTPTPGSAASTSAPTVTQTPAPTDQPTLTVTPTPTVP